MKVLIPLAGTAKRFKESDHIFPKPLVSIHDKPMIQWVLDNLSPLKAEYIFIINNEDVIQYNLNCVLEQLSPGCEIIVQNSSAQGAACSSLLAIESINNSDELLICGGDQFITDDIGKHVKKFRESADGGLITFNSVHPQYSFVRVNSEGQVLEVAEKRPISNKACAGFYWYRQGTLFVESSMKMIRKDDKVNGQFYLCPTYNQLILEGKKIISSQLEEGSFFTFGTPEKVREYNFSKSLIGYV